jgi:hypothetical protein
LQSDREKEQGLPVAPFMDREKVTKPTAQIGFIKFVLIPMFETVSKVCGASDLSTIIPVSWLHGFTTARIILSSLRAHINRKISEKLAPIFDNFTIVSCLSNMIKALFPSH